MILIPPKKKIIKTVSEQKRFETASIILHALVNKHSFEYISTTKVSLVRFAYELTDELIKQKDV